MYAAMVTGPQNMPVFNDMNLTTEDKRDIISALLFLQENESPGGFSLGLARPRLGGPLHLDLRHRRTDRHHRVDHGEVELIAHDSKHERGAA